MTGELYLSATTLLEDVATALANGTTKVPDRRFVTVGAITWAGQCDQLVVSLMGTWLTNTFPIPASLDPAGQCDVPLIGADLTLSVIRCFPAVDAAGNLPGVDAVQAVAQKLGADMQTIINAAPCALADQVALPSNLIEDYVVDVARVVGPEGGRVALEMPYKIGLRRG
jgi:hypothetical protein